MKAPFREEMIVKGYSFGKGEPAACILGPVRGNEIQQLYICSQLVRALKELEANSCINSNKEILVIPVVGNYSMNVGKRFWGEDNSDINRMFPGYDLGETTQRIADGVFKEIKDYNIGVQFSSFYNPGEFMPHIRIMKEGYSDIELAKNFDLPYVILRKVRPYDTTTLNYNWQVWETMAYSFYTTSTTRIDRKSAGMAVLSVMKFLSSQGIVDYKGSLLHESKIVEDVDMLSVQTAKSGIFEPLVKVGEAVEEGQPLANIVNPYDGECMETLYSPADSTVFFMHSDPLTYANTAVFKLI